MEILRPEQQVMEGALKVRSVRAELLAGNVANTDTPGYIARDVKFDAALSQLLDHDTNSSTPSEALISAANLRYDRNDIDVSQQLAKAYENSLSYVATLKLYGDSIGRLRLAASNG